MNKVMIKGYFEFGNPNTYDKVFKTFQQKKEVYYKNDILLKEPEGFDEVLYRIDVPKLLTLNVSEKTWKNTYYLIECMAQFAISGIFSIWITNKKDVVQLLTIEPKSEKGAVQDYIRGRAFGLEPGKEVEAFQSMNAAIEKFDRHATAYAYRGHLQLNLGNYDDALLDFTRSIEYSMNHPEAHNGRAAVLMAKGDYVNAIADLELALQKAVPMQSAYWEARRLKGESHFRIGEFEKAAFELKFFTKRAFLAEDPNIAYRKSAWLTYGMALLELKDYAESMKAFNAASEIKNDSQYSSEVLLYRALARRHAGHIGFEKDLKAAADLGSQKAQRLLEELV